MSQSKLSYFEQDFEVNRLPSQNDADFWNIVLLDEEGAGLDFLQRRGAAVYINSFDAIHTLSQACPIYFAPSVNFVDCKQKLIKHNWGAAVDFGVDPFSLGLWQSKLFKHDSQAIDFESIGENKVFRFSTLAYDLSGASDDQQVAILLSSMSQLIGDFEGKFSPQEVLGMTSFEITVSPNIFKSVTKIQGFRLMYHQFLLEMGIQNAAAPSLFVIPSPRYLSTREPWNNILRLTSMNSAAMLGGASGIVNLPYDLFSQSKQSRLSRNIGLILEEESYLRQVNDPSFGGFATDLLLKETCAKSSEFYHEIIKKDGLKKSINSGWLQNEIQRAAIQQVDDVTFCKSKMTGVNDFCLTRSLDSKYPLVEERNSKSVEDWFREFACKESLEGQCDVERLVPFQLSRIFEKWQFLGDRHREKCRVRLHIEEGMENAPKTINIKRLLALGGFEFTISEKSTLNAIVAMDPAGEFCRERLAELKKNPSNFLIWVGEKEMDGFDTSLGETLNLPKVFEKLFSVLGVQ